MIPFDKEAKLLLRWNHLMDSGPTQADIDLWDDKQEAIGRPILTDIEHSLIITQEK